MRQIAPISALIGLLWAPLGPCNLVNLDVPKSMASWSHVVFTPEESQLLLRNVEIHLSVS